MKSILIAVTLLAGAVVTDAQQAGKVPRVGWLTGGSLSEMTLRQEAFRQGLRELGYVEGKNLIIEWRGAEGRRDRQRALAVELVNLKVQVIVTAGGSSTRAAREATSTIPIVMTSDDDPVGSGLVASLARPGGNVTGMSTLAPELNGKRLEILKEVVPKLSHVAVFGTSKSASYAPDFKEIELAAKALRLTLQHIDVLVVTDFEPAFRAAIKAKAGAALMNASGSLASTFREKEIAALAVKNRLPVIYSGSRYVDNGGLLSYGVNVLEFDRRAAVFVDKILKGTKPADLPVEQAMKFDFTINLKSANAISLTIPPNVLVRATRVIK